MAGEPPLRLPSDATREEAAAIVAAVEQLLAEEGRGPSAGGDDPWSGRRFAFAGRLEKLGRPPARLPGGAPADPWTAAVRLRRP